MRWTEETKNNERSSRSHAIVNIHLCFKETIKADSKEIKIKKTSQLNFIDLAGSERQQQQSNKERFKEGCYINKSLLNLHKCIQQLSE